MSLYDRIPIRSRFIGARRVSCRPTFDPRKDTDSSQRPRVGHASGASSWQRRGSSLGRGSASGPIGPLRIVRRVGTERSVVGALERFRKPRVPLPRSPTERSTDSSCSGSPRRRPRSNRRPHRLREKGARGSGGDRGAATRARRVHGSRDYARYVVSLN